MIIENGYIQTKMKTGGGVINGIPQPAVTSWGDPIPCNIKKSTDDRMGTYIDGNFRRVQATILIEPQEFEAKEIKVTDNRDKVLGEFEVQSITFLHATQALQITV
jgi:hypothetical protein